MPVRRTYGCETCGLEWTVTHASGDEAYPDCPVCVVKATWRPKGFRTRSAKTRQIDFEKDVAAKQFGLSDMSDSTREGDTAATAALKPQTTVEREAMIQQTSEAMRQVAESIPGTIVRPEMQASLVAAQAAFNGGPPPATQVGGFQSSAPGQVMALAKYASDAQKAEMGESPMQTLHRGLKTGRHDTIKRNIIARAPLG